MSPVTKGSLKENEFSNHDGLVKATTTQENVWNIYDEEKKETTAAVYDSSDDSYSLEYISAENGVKENIVLNEVPDTNSWQFQMKLEGITPELDTNSNGINLFETGTDSLVGGIQTPNMNDATENAYSEAIHYSIDKKNGEEDTYIITLTADKQYLQSKDRVYPVTIDPTISWAGNGSVDDAYVISGSYADTNFYSSSVTTMCAGRSSQGLCRTYMTFPELRTTVTGKSVSSAKLTVYETGSYKGEKVQAHRVTESWKRTAITWNTRASYVSTAFTSFTSTGVTGQASTLDLTPYARGVAKGSISNYGIMLRAEDEICIFKEYSIKSNELR